MVLNFCLSVGFLLAKEEPKVIAKIAAENE